MGLQLYSPQEQGPRGTASKIATFLIGYTFSPFCLFGRGAAEANFIGDTIEHVCGPDFHKNISRHISRKKTQFGRKRFPGKWVETTSSNPQLA